MKNKIPAVIIAALIVMGCARVQVVAPKEPIKVDIAMRLDVYQHVENDINAIEDIVSGNKPASIIKSMLDNVCATAYAADGLPPVVEEAALRRQGRLAEISSAEAAGSVGENASGLLEIRGPSNGDAALAALVAAENSDRAIIYKAVSDKNGASLSEVRKMYAKKLQANAPAGTPIETAPGSWERK